ARGARGGGEGGGGGGWGGGGGLPGRPAMRTALPGSPLWGFDPACCSGAETAVSGGLTICPSIARVRTSYPGFRPGGAARQSCPFCHWYELPRPPKLMCISRFSRSPGIREWADEYHSVESITTRRTPPGV